MNTIIEYKWKGMPSWAYKTKQNKLNHSVMVYANDYDTIGYEQLSELAEAFGTKKISFENIPRSGGCDTCGNGSVGGYIEILVDGVTRWPESE